MQRRAFLQATSLATAGLVLGRRRLAARTLPPRHFDVLDLPRKPLLRGRAHGEALKPKIRSLCDEWKRALMTPRGSTPDDYLRQLVGETRFLDAAARWTPDLLEEVKGIAEASDVPLVVVQAMQLVDEEWWFGTHKRLDAAVTSRPGDGKRSGDKCTAIGVSRSAHGPSMVAQNMDIPGYADGNMVILRVKQPDSDLEALVLTYAGLVCLNGVNNRGVGLCVNALLDLKPSPDGLPVAFTNRGVLARATLADAERFLRDITLASGQCYNVGGPDKVASFECSAGKVAPYAAGEHVFAHANHALASEDWSRIGEMQRRRRAAAASRAASQPAASQQGGNSERRQAAAEKRLRDAGDKVTVDTIKDALGSHDDKRNPVCCHHDSREQGYTAAATIYVLGDRPQMHVSAGPPCSGAFAVHGF